MLARGLPRFVSMRFAWMALAMGLLAGGCSTAPVAGEPDVAAAYPKVTLTRPLAAKKIKLNPAIVKRNEMNHLTVTQPIRAANPDPMNIQYRFIWLDESGAPIPPEMTWRYKRLEPRVPDFLTATASSEQAVDYRVQVRPARP